MNIALKYLYNKFVHGQQKWYPFVSVYYLTYNCDFRCSYCSDGAGNPYYRVSSEDPTGPEALRIIEKIRQYTGYLILTGGEPLNHKEFDLIAGKIRQFRFRNVILTTNGYNLEKHLEAVSASVDSLVVSLDTMEPTKADSIYGKGSGAFGKIIANLEAARNVKNRRYDICISSVVTPSNIEDLYDVYEYSASNGFMFAACPQLVGVNPHGDLTDNDEYRKFYDFLIREKRQHGKIFGSVKYLQYMRGLKQFRCTPFAMLVVSPSGTLFYPCLEIGHPAANILEVTSLHDAKKAGCDKYGPQPDCGNQCQSACALTFSLLLG